MAQTKHFVVIHRHKVIYGRVPKVANTAIKEILAQNVPRVATRGLRPTNDAYWNHCTRGETALVSPQRAAHLVRQGYFCFSFVRDPVERAISCYSNKFVRN